jgi:hypothetical protein
MKRAYRSIPFLACLVLLALAPKAHASIPPHLIDIDEPGYGPAHNYTLFFASYHDLGRGFDARSIQPVNYKPEFTVADMGTIIPASSMQPGEASGKCAARIVDYSVNNFLKSPRVKQSSVGRTATSVQNSLQTNASFGGTEPGAIKHSFQFAMKPIENKAELKYTGYTHAQLTYVASQSRVSFYVYENIYKATRIGFTNFMTPLERSSMMNIGWAF